MDRISDIEDLMIDALKEAIPDAHVETRSVPLTEAELTKILGMAPFVYIEYAGGASARQDESGQTLSRKLEFNLFVAARSLRSKQEAQRGSYELLMNIFNALDHSTLSNTETGKKAGPFEWSSEAAVFVSDDGGTVYQSVYTLTEMIQ